MLDAKGGQGLNSMSKTVIGLHLAANQAGVAVDSQAMSKVNDQLILVYQWWKSAAKHFFHLISGSWYEDKAVVRQRLLER